MKSIQQKGTNTNDSNNKLYNNNKKKKREKQEGNNLLKKRKQRKVGMNRMWWVLAQPPYNLRGNGRQSPRVEPGK